MPTIMRKMYLLRTKYRKNMNAVAMATKATTMCAVTCTCSRSARMNLASELQEIVYGCTWCLQRALGVDIVSFTALAAGGQGRSVLAP